MNRPAATFLRSGLTATVVRTLLVTLLLGFLQIIQGPSFLPQADAVTTVGTGVCASSVGNAAYVQVYTSATKCILEFDTTTTWAPPVGVATVYFLAVGGGGGGASGRGGGGGAGGLETGTTSVIGASMTMNVGTGGAGGGGSASNGNDSYFGLITHAYGGGGGGNSFGASSNVQAGGSGGGAGIYQNATTGGWAGGTSTGGQGNSGGGSGYPYADLGTSGYNYDKVRNAGGGGGAGGPGIAAQGGKSGQNWDVTNAGLPTMRAGDGGPGVLVNITGTSKCYAGGGGAAFGYFYASTEWTNYYSATQGSGGGCGATIVGGNGGDYKTTTTGGNGVANTGSGGGAGSVDTTPTASPGGAGGSGVIVVSWLKTSVNAITSPVSQTIIRGETFTLTASGTPDYAGVTRTWRWQQSSNGGTSWTNVGVTDTKTTSTYIETGTTTINGYQYRAMYTDSDGVTTDTGTTTAATITVLSPPTTTDTDIVLNLSGSQYAYSSPVAALNDTFTVELWVKPGTSCTSSSDTLLLQKSSTLIISCHDNRFWVVTKDNSGTNLTVVDFNNLVETNTWQHLAVTRAGATNAMLAYYNGMQGNSWASAALNTNSTQWNIGGSASITNFNGQIDEVKIWNTARTAANIKTDMHGFTSASASGLVDYWDFNETATSRVYDQASAATGLSDLFFVGSPTFVENRTVDTTTVTGVTIVKFIRSYITKNGGWKTPAIAGSIRALNVAGGGAGGADRGGGGGAGGRLYTILNNLPSIETITVGMGGSAAFSGAAGFSGESSTLGTLVAHGGGGGGASAGNVQYQGAGLPGGSGGGGAFSATYGQDSGTGNTGKYSPPEGYNGAPSLVATERNTGGGGGATGVGISGSGGDSTTAGSVGVRPDGGPGDTLSITGVAVQYAAGGGGARALGGAIYPSYESVFKSAPPGRGGAIGCGTGANVFEQFGGDGCYNTGGGGGGGGTNYTIGGSSIISMSGRGGSGIVVLRYITAAPTAVAPSDTSIVEGDTPTFKISSTPVGSLVRGYRWQYETSTGTTWLNVTDGTGYDTVTYTLPQQNNRARNQYHYRVQITDTDTVTGETVTSYTESATLTVRAPLDLDGDYAATFSSKEAKSLSPLTFTGSTISAEMWVNRTSSCSGVTDSYAMNFNNVIGFTCRNNEWHGKLYSGSADNDINFNEAPQLNQWHHLAMTFTGGIWYAYYDGQEVESTSAITFAPASNNYLYVGNNGGTGYFDGQVDEIKIWSTNRRTSISTDLHDAVDTSTTGLFAYYNFNEIGTVLHDRDASAVGFSDLIPTGTAWTTQTIDSSSVVGSNRLYQFPRTIINSYGGWALPKASTFPTAMLVGGGGGGTGNAGYGGAGGGVLKGKVTVNNTTSRLKVKVGTGGINSYSYNSAVATAPIFVGGTGGTTSIVSADSTVNAVVTGGVGGPNHWKDNRCQNPASGTEAANYNASPSAGGAPTSTTGITVLKNFTGTGGGLIDPAQGAPSDAAAGTSDSITGTTHIYGGGGGSGGWNIAGSNGGGDGGNAQGGSGNAGGQIGDPGTDAYAYYGGGGGGGGDSCQVNGGRGGTGVVYLLYPLNAVDFVNPVDTKTSIGQYTTFTIGGDANPGFTRSYEWQTMDSGTATWVTQNGANFNWTIFDATTKSISIGNSSNLIQDKSMNGMRVRAKIIDTNDITSETISAYSESATLTIYDQFILTGGGSAIRTPFGVAASSLAFTSTGGVTPIKWSLVSPPTGITIDSVTAIITAGITAQPAQYALTVKATDAVGASLTESATAYVGSLPILMVGDVFSWIDTGTNFSVSNKTGKSSFTLVNIDSSGNIYGFGYSDSANFTIGGSTPTTSAGYHFVKVDKNGVLKWVVPVTATRYNSQNPQISGKKITVDSAGNIYFVAYASGSVNFGGKPILFNSVDYSTSGSFVVKMDSSSTVQWIARLDAGSFVRTNGMPYTGTSRRGFYGDISGVAVDSTGNVYLSGIQVGDFGLVSGPQNAQAMQADGNGVYCSDPNAQYMLASCGISYTLMSGTTNGDGSGYFEIGYLIKLDSTGTPLWNYTTVASNAHVAFSSVDIDSGGNILLSGTVDRAVTFRGLSLSSRLTGYGRVFAMKLDSDGNGIWVNQDGGGVGSGGAGVTRGDQIFTAFTDPSGAIYIAGSAKGGTTLNGVAMPWQNGSTQYQAAIAFKFDNAGNRVWSKQLTSDNYGDSYWYSGGADQNGNMYLTGRIKDAVTLNGISYSYTGKVNPLIEYSPNGTPIYLAAYGGTSSAADTIKSIAVDPLGNIAAAGVINDTTTLDSFAFVPKADDDAFIGMLRNNSSGLSASLTAKYGTTSYSPTVVVFGGTAPFVLTLNNNYSNKIIADTSSGVSVVYSNATSLIPGIYPDSITVVDSLSQTYTLLETLTVTKADTVTVTPTTPVGLVYNNGDTITWTETVSVTPLVNNDTVTTTIYYSGTANSGETYSATNIVMPKKAGTYTITPLITAVSYGTVSAGQLAYYQYTKYETATLSIGRATRALRIDNAAYSNLYVGAANETITLYATGAGNDTVTVTWTLVTGSCTLGATGKLFATVATACVVNISVPQTDNYLAASDTRTINFYLFTSGFDGSNQNAGGPHTIILDFNNYLETATITTAADSSTTTIAPVITSVTQTAGGIGSGSNTVIEIVGANFWTTAGSVTVNFGRNVDNRNATAYITSRTPIKITLSIPDSYMTANGFTTGVSMGRAAVITPAGEGVSATPALRVIVVNG